MSRKIEQRDFHNYAKFYMRYSNFRQSVYKLGIKLVFQHDFERARIRVMITKNTASPGQMAQFNERFNILTGKIAKYGIELVQEEFDINNRTRPEKPRLKISVVWILVISQILFVSALWYIQS